MNTAVSFSGITPEQKYRNSKCKKRQKHNPPHYICIFNTYTHTHIYGNAWVYACCVFQSLVLAYSFLTCLPQSIKYFEIRFTELKSVQSECSVHSLAEVSGYFWPCFQTATVLCLLGSASPDGRSTGLGHCRPGLPGPPSAPPAPTQAPPGSGQPACLHQTSSSRNTSWGFKKDLRTVHPSAAQNTTSGSPTTHSRENTTWLPICYNGNILAGDFFHTKGLHTKHKIKTNDNLAYYIVFFFKKIIKTLPKPLSVRLFEPFRCQIQNKSLTQFT